MKVNVEHKNKYKGDFISILLLYYRSLYSSCLA